MLRWALPSPTVRLALSLGAPLDFPARSSQWILVSAFASKGMIEATNPDGLNAAACLFVYTFAYPFDCLFTIDLSIYPATNVSMCLCVSTSFYLPVYLSSIHPCVHYMNYLSIHPGVHPLIHASIQPSIYRVVVSLCADLSMFALRLYMCIYIYILIYGCIAFCFCFSSVCS